MIIMEDKIRAGSPLKPAFVGWNKTCSGNPAGARVEIVGGSVNDTMMPGTITSVWWCSQIRFLQPTGIPGGVGQNMLRNSSRAVEVGNDDLFRFLHKQSAGDNVNAEHGFNEDSWALATSASPSCVVSDRLLLGIPTSPYHSSMFPVVLGSGTGLAR